VNSSSDASRPRGEHQGRAGGHHAPASGSERGCRCGWRALGGCRRLGHRLDYESHATGLDRNEVGALLVAAGLGSPAGHALISLLALNGLRVSEATGADIESLGTERGHRTLAITRKGGKKAVIPLAPRTARAVDLAIAERCAGPIFTTTAGERLDRHGAGRVVRRAGLAKKIGPHTLRHAFITAALDAGVPLRDVQEAASHADPRTTMRYDRARVSPDRHATCIVAAYIAGAAR
jgi:integrase/recombinase XerD